MSDEPVHVYTDGGADPNPGVGGWGAVLVWPGRAAEELSGGEPVTTNNRMEMMAALCALETLPVGATVVVHTDSRYLQRGITEWLPKWRAMNWRRKGDGEVKNLDLWQRLAAVTAERKVGWKWVKGHSGVELNERADALATEAIERLKEGRGGSKPAGTAGSADGGADNSGDGGAGTTPAEAGIVIYQRVSASKGRGMWIGLVRTSEASDVQIGVEAKASANRLDLLAAVTLLEAQPAGLTVAIYTASDLLRHGATLWLRGWQKKAYRTKGGDQVANRDLWERLAEVLAHRTVLWPEIDDAARTELKVLEAMAREAVGPGS